MEQLKFWGFHTIVAGSWIGAEFLNLLPKVVGLMAAILWLLVAWQTWRNKRAEKKILDKKLNE